MLDFCSTDVPVLFKEYFASASSSDINYLVQSLNLHSSNRKEVDVGPNLQKSVHEPGSLQYSELLWKIRRAVGSGMGHLIGQRCILER